LFVVFLLLTSFRFFFPCGGPQVDDEDPSVIVPSKHLAALINRKPTDFKAWVDSVVPAFSA
jgi:hypothetical protein